LEGPHSQPPGWTIDQSAALYRIRRWGHPYFDVNADGRVAVRADPSRERGVDLHDLALELGARGLDLPLLIRFPDIVEHRIRLINEAFARAVGEYGYQGSYRGVYPVKVNQQRHLVEDIVDAGRPWHYGLEAGSKPELLIALAAMQDEGGFIICNGYKDLAYVETALVAQQLDNTVVVVLERIEELGIVLQAYEKLGIRPVLGIRAKLSSKGIGRWASSTGDRAKFGLTTAEWSRWSIEAGRAEMLDCLQLLHFHMGSQVSSIIPIKNAMREATNIYVELAKMGCQMRYFDVGGGLGVDYDGSQTDFHASMQLRPCRSTPTTWCTPSRRPATRRGPPPHHRERERPRGRGPPVGAGVRGGGVDEFADYQAPTEPRTMPTRHPPAVLDLQRASTRRTCRRAGTTRSRPSRRRCSLFNLGYLGLREPGQASSCSGTCCEQDPGHGAPASSSCRRSSTSSRDPQLRSTYCNFSIFQSLPDTWAIDQLFPSCRSTGSTRSRPPRHPGRPHLRLRRQDRPLHRRAKRSRSVLELHPRCRPASPTAGHVPGRRLPGDPRRPAQPLRRHQRGACPHDRHGLQRGACAPRRLHRVRCCATCSTIPRTWSSACASRRSGP
jgi:arginine decarboxylase